MGIKVIITGATGMVGEGVLLGCLEDTAIEQVLIVNRKPAGREHAKLKELLVPDFLKVEEFADQLKGYDACFYCAGISSVGVTEEKFTHAIYDTTLHFATTLSGLNPGMIFTYVSGKGTDSSEKGKLMWARVKGRTENALTRLPFKKAYNFRPGFMKPVPGQKNVQTIIKVFTALYPVLIKIWPNSACPMSDVARAMINCVTKGYDKQVLEVKDIKALAAM